MANETLVRLGDAYSAGTSSRPWPLPPLVPGDWKDLSTSDAVAVLARYSAAELAGGLTPSALAVEFGRVRARRVHAAPRWLLFEAEARFADGAEGLLTFFYGPGHRMVGADWSAGHLADFDFPATWTEQPLQQARSYLFLFVNYIRAEEGRFVIVQTAVEVRQLSRAGTILDEAVVKKARPFQFKAVGELFEGEGTVAYGGTLYNAQFRVGRDGFVDMCDDDPIGEIAMDVETVRGPFRVIDANTATAAR